MKLVPRLTGLAERLTGLQTTFGNPLYKPVTIRLDSETVTPLTPMRVEQVNPRNIGDWLSDTVQIYGDELLVWVPRTYPEDVVSKGQLYIGTNEETTGDTLHVDRNEPIWWVVTMKPRRNR
jgi:hypothetical protein